ncbi:unnamed protein product [Vicia faba]|uniref:TRAF-type domain-containing protein n=1 Tax=Vicia faba TaxID=3906 RepID=A0AAV0YZE1_VICFA|nr:unnamed protein product [Vicia faba]
MDLPTIDVDLGPKKIEDEKESGPLFHCDLCDTEVVHKLAQMFLPGLASACVDNTTGGLFKTPGSVTVDLRKEMIQYLTLRSQSFVAESLILQDGPDDEVSDHPFDIISNFVDDFASSKRNFFSRVSAWLLSDKREDKIDDFIQEIDMNGFWTLDRRQLIAETLLKNVDFNNLYHCTDTFNSSQELSNHLLACDFRPLICQNQGCNARFCAGLFKKHDSVCPFKVIPCEQRCSSSIMRRDMDRHCITACPMKLVNCPFYAVGCRSAVAQCMIEKHCSDDFQSHLWHLLKGTYKEVSGDDLQRRVVQILQASPSSNLSKARDVRSLTFIVKNIESTLGPMEITVEQKNSEENITKKDDSDDTNTNNDGEQNTQASSDKAGISDITIRTAENTGKSEERENIRTEIEGSEERIQTSNISKLPDDAETVHVSEGITQNYKENNDAAASEFKSNDKEESTQTNMEKLAEEVSATNEDYVPNNYKENNDATDREFMIKGNEEDTQTNKEKLAEETSATNEDFVHDNNSIKNGHMEDNDNVPSTQNSNMETAGSAESNLKNKDNVESIHNSNMEATGSAENNVKNKDTEDDNLK